MELRWLQLNRPCILEIPQVKDYGGQPLIFKTGMLRRCVRADALQHPLVRAYMDQHLIIEVTVDGEVTAPKAAPTPSVDPAPLTPEVVPDLPPAEPEVVPALPPAEPEATPEPPQPEPAPEVTDAETPVEVPTAMPSEPVSEVPEISSASVSSEESTASVAADDSKGFELKRRRRG